MNDSRDDLRTVSSPGPGHGRAFVLFALVGLFAYFGSLHGAYVLDDFRFTLDPNRGRPFSSSMAPRPLIALSLAVNYWVDGLNPRGYHAMNLAAHILAGLLLYDLVRRTLLMPRFKGRFDSSAGWIGLTTGLVWMVHPLNTQAVTYIIQRCESFMGLFLLASLWCYIRGATASRNVLWWNLAAVVNCALGAACKEMMIVLAPLALLWDRTFLTGSWRSTIRARWLSLGLLALPPVAGIAALAISGFFTDTGGTVGFGVRIYTPYTYALTQTEVIFHYLKLSFFPVGLTLDYLDWKPCTSLASCWPSVVALAVLVAITTIGVLWRSAWSFPVAWFFICLAPTSSIVPVQDAVFEHRMYLPLAGIVTLVVCGFGSLAMRFAIRPRVLGAIAGVLIVTLGLMTASRNEDYSSTARLTRDNVERRPENGRARMNLAMQLFSMGDVAGAEEHLNVAMKLPLQLPALRREYIKVMRESGRPSEAVRMAEINLKNLPDSLEATYELGLSLLMDDRVADSLPYLEKAAQRPGATQFERMHYGVALQQSGQVEKAAAEFRATHEMDSAYAAKLSQTARRVANDPEAKPSHLRLTVWYADAACRMIGTPTAEMLDTLAMGEARLGRFDQAAKTASRAAILARQRGDAYLADRLDIRASLFRQKKTHLPETREVQP